MASVHVTNTWFNSQAKAALTVFDKTNPMAPVLYTEWLNTLEGEADRSFFQALPFYGFGQFQLLPEKGSPALDQGGEGTPVFYPFVSYALKYGVSKPGRREDPYKINPRLPKFLKYAEIQTRENLYWNILTQSMNSAVPIWDGQALCSQTHKLAGDGATYSNLLGNVAFTVESFQQALVLMATLPDDRNLASWRSPKWGISVPGYQRVMEEVLGSRYYPHSDENRVNTAYGKVDPLIVRYIPSQPNGPFPWWISSGKGELGADAHASFVSLKYAFEQKVWYDDDTDVMYHKSEFRSTWGSVDGRGLVGSGGA